MSPPPAVRVEPSSALAPAPPLVIRRLGWLRRVGPWLLGLALGGGVLAAVVWLLAGALRGSADSQPLTAAVRRDTLVVSVTEGGTVQSREMVTLRSEVETRTTIVWVIEEGKQVKKGDKLAELDGSDLKDKLTQQEITWEQAAANQIQAKEALEIQKNQNDSDIKKAELDVLFAEMDLQKYVEGEGPQERRKAETNITIAGEELKRAKERLRWTRELAQKGYVNKTELEADELAQTKCELELVQAQEALRLFEKYTYPKTVKELTSRLEEARKNLERVQRKAASELAKVQADLKAKEKTLLVQTAQLNKLKEQLEATVIRAPCDGMVAYAKPDHWWDERRMISPGAEVHYRQKLFEFPGSDKMNVETRVHESVVDQVRVGLPARLVVDAFPDRVLTGRVTQVALLPDQVNRWLNPDLKVYKAVIEIDQAIPGMKPGMSAEVTIELNRVPDALIVPVQAVVKRKGQRVCYRVDPDGPRPVTVKTGAANDQFIQILEGLNLGEQVLLNPPRDTSAEAEPEPPESPERPQAEPAPPGPPAASRPARRARPQP